MTNDESGRPKGVSIWVVAAICVVLLAVGIVMLVGGDTQGSTSLVEVSQRRAAPPGPMMPDGSDVPEGVAEVHEADGARTYALVAPAGWLEVEGEPDALIAPLTFEQVDGGSTLAISVGCAASADEYLAQLAVTETPASVTVMAVAVQPDDGAPCDPAAPQREFRLPLQDPAGSRAVVVVPAGPLPR